MFDIGAAELLLVAIVALVVIGPKDLPAALRGVGRVMGQLRSLTGQFRFSLDSIIREAEIEGQEKDWAQKNADIMAEHPPGESDVDLSQQAPDQTGSDGSAGNKDVEMPDHSDGEMRSLKPIATDEAGDISSMNEHPVRQSPSESASAPQEDSSQTDLFGDKT
jgi:sec-independent protein translocase protein TatB